MKRLIGVLSVATLAAVLAAPLAAQTIRVTASVPFEFMVAGRSLPAGDYTVDTLSSDIKVVRVSNSSSAVVSMAQGATANSKERSGQALLIFHRYGDQYFLARIVDGRGELGLEIPASHTERELFNTASLEKFETIAVLARR